MSCVPTYPENGLGWSSGWDMFVQQYIHSTSKFYNNIKEYFIIYETYNIRSVAITAKWKAIVLSF